MMTVEQFLEKYNDCEVSVRVERNDRGLSYVASITRQGYLIAIYSSPQSVEYAIQLAVDEAQFDLRQALTANQHTACSKCGGELDSDGWCANYCMDYE